MAWSASGIFRQTMIDSAVRTTTALDFDAASMFKVALYNNSITPDFDIAAASSAFNTGQWSNTNEVTATGWVTGGVVLASNAVTAITKGYKFTGSNTSGGSTDTMSNIFGCLVYADAITTPVADIGLLGVYFGSAFSVTNGTFTIQWNASGIFTFTGP